MKKPKLYTYTTYLPDGTATVSKPQPRAGLVGLQTMVNGRIEIVPPDYYKHQKWGHCTVFVNEEEASEDQNPFFKDYGDGYFIRGVAVKEKVYREVRSVAS